MRAGSTSRSHLAVLLVALGCGAFHLVRYRHYVLDDTYISLRYARNLVEGNGLVFNVGERVEGYTNFLFVLLAALFLKLGIDVVLALKVILLGAALVTLLLVARMAREIGVLAVLPVALLIACEPFVYWALCPMETMLVTALLVAAVHVQWREAQTGSGRGSALLYVLLALTRPEGAYLFTLATGAFAVIEWRAARSSAAVVRHAANAAVFAVLFGAYSAWRYAYYGSLLPNTFYAKVTGGEGQLLTAVRYLGEWCTAFPLLVLGGAAAALGRGRPPLVSALAAVTGGYILYVVGVGGDFMPFFRFFLPCMPFLALLLARLSIRRPLPGAALLALFLLHVALSLHTEQPYRAFVAHRTAVVGAEVGKHLAANFAADDWIATNTAGSLPYHSRLPAIDMLGLTDAAIAHRPVYIVSTGWAGHRRGWGEYVLARRPRAIFFYNSAGSRAPHYLGDHELADHPLFRFFYVARRTVLPPAAAGTSPIARFLGHPFGYSSEGQSESGELGLRVRFADSWPRHTIFSEGPIVADYFELERRDAALWEEAGGNVDALLDAAVSRWLAERSVAPPPDPAARAEVEAMCEEARQKVAAGDLPAARSLLSAAARRNGSARSPLVYQYVANLAVSAGDLFLAVGAEKEALRLEPGSALYRRNLRSLLTVPYEQAVKPALRP